jgi:hypothetical protein
MHMLRQQLLAERAKEIRFDEYIESNFNEKLALHLVQLDVAKDWKQFREAAVSDWLVLPHLVC